MTQRPVPPAPAVRPVAAPALKELPLPILGTLDGKVVRGANFLGGLLLVLESGPVFVIGGKWDGKTGNFS